MAKRVLHYLEEMVDHGLFYQKGNVHQSAYCDVNWASNPYDRKLAIGFSIFLCSCLISWDVEKKQVIFRSKNEEGYR